MQFAFENKLLKTMDYDIAYARRYKLLSNDYVSTMFMSVF